MTDTRDGRDIVERLRHAPVVFGTEMFGATRLLEDAASEIERLRSQRVAVPEGWCLVPSAPTDAMIHAGRCETSKIDDDDDYTQAHVCYRAMLSASPQPPTDTLSSERARVIEECAMVAETLQIVEGEPSPELIEEMKADVALTAEAAGRITARRIASAIRALAHGGDDGQA